MADNKSNILESRDHARTVREILHKAWWTAYCATHGQLGDADVVKRALNRVTTEAMERFGNNAAHPECQLCREY